MEQKTKSAKILSLVETRRRRNRPDYFAMYAPHPDDQPPESPEVEAAMWRLMDIIFPKAEVIPHPSSHS